MVSEDGCHFLRLMKRKEDFMTEEQRERVAENHNLIYAFLNKYQLPIEEYYDLAAIGLCKAAEKFNPGLSEFSTFAYYWMRSMVFDELRKKYRVSQVPKEQIVYYQAGKEGRDGEVPVFEIPSKESVEEQVMVKMVVKNFMDSLEERELKILNLLEQGFTQQEVGTVVGMSQVDISRTKTRLKKRLLALYY